MLDTELKLITKEKRLPKYGHVIRADNSPHFTKFFAKRVNNMIELRQAFDANIVVQTTELDLHRITLPPATLQHNSSMLDGLGYAILKPKNKKFECYRFRINKTMEETIVRIDLPVYIDTETNIVTQTKPPKKRKLDRKAKKELKEYVNSFEHEFSVLRKLNISFTGPLVILGTSYGEHVETGQTRYYMRNYDRRCTLLNKEFYKDRELLTEQDRLNIAILTKTLLVESFNVVNKDNTKPWTMVTSELLDSTEDHFLTEMGALSYEEQ